MAFDFIILVFTAIALLARHIEINPVVAPFITIRLVGSKVRDGEGWVIRSCGEAGECQNRDGFHDDAVEIDGAIDGARMKKVNSQNRSYL